MLRRARAAVLAAGITALALAAPAVAATPPGTLDQHHECSAVDCNLADQVAFPAWLSEQGLQANSTVGMAERFTPSISGPISGVELYLKIVDSGSPTPIDVSITPTVGGIPQVGSALATTTLTPTAGSGGWGSLGSPAWIPVTFASHPNLTAGVRYAIVVGWSLPATTWLQWEVDASWGTSGYTGYTQVVGGEGQVGTHVGSAYNWYEVAQIPSLNPNQNGYADYAFRTYMGAAVATPTPTARPTATPFVPTQPPTDTTGTVTGPSSSGWLPLLVMLAVIVGAALLVPRGTRATRRR